MTLDRHLKDVIAAVGTALDECRKQTGEQFDDEMEFETRIANPSAQPGARILAKKSDEIGLECKALNAELTSAKNPQSAQAERLSRTLNDIGGLNKLIGVELKIRNAVLIWLKSLGLHISNYPDLLKKLGSSLEVGADIAVPAWTRWHSAWHKIGIVVIDEVRGFGSDLRTQVEKWESEVRVKAPPRTSVDAQDESQPSDSSEDTSTTNSANDQDVRRHVLIDMAKRDRANSKFRQGAILDLITDFRGHGDTFRLLAERAFNDPSQAIRRQCVAEIGSMRLAGENYNEMHGTLIEIYNNEAIPSIGTTVLRTIIRNIVPRHDNEKICLFLGEILGGDHPSDHKTLAIKALHDHFSASAIALSEILRAARSDPSVDVRCRALSAISGTFGGDRETQDVVFDILKRTNDLNVRYTALKAVERQSYIWPDCDRFLTTLSEQTRDRRFKRELKRVLSASGA